MKENSKIYYYSIEEMPLYNWIKCTEANDKQYMRKGKNGNEKGDIEAWNKVYTEYIEQYGLTKYYKRLLEQYKKKAVAELNFVITGDRFELTRIAMESQKLERILNNGGKGITIEKSLIHLSKWLGYWLQSKKISVKEYFDLNEEFNRINKATEHGEKDKQ